MYLVDFRHSQGVVLVERSEGRSELVLAKDVLGLVVGLQVVALGGLLAQDVVLVRIFALNGDVLESTQIKYIANKK